MSAILIATKVRAMANRSPIRANPRSSAAKKPLLFAGNRQLATANSGIKTLLPWKWQAIIVLDVCLRIQECGGLWPIKIFDNSCPE